MGTLTMADVRDRLAAGYPLNHLWSETVALLEEHPELKSHRLLERLQQVRRALLVAGPGPAGQE